MENLSLKVICVICLSGLLSYNTSFSQPQNDYLKANSFDISSQVGPLSKEDFKIMGFGAYHGSAKTDETEIILLDTLVNSQKIKYYLPETDFSLGHYFNQYIESGDDTLLRELVFQYGKRVPQEESIECYNKWEKLREIFRSQAKDDQILVIGIDAIYSYAFTAKHLLSIIGAKHSDYQSFRKLNDLYHSPSKFDDLSKNELFDIFKECLEEYEQNESDFLSFTTDKYALIHIMDNIRDIINKKNRESIIFENYVRLMPIYDFEIKPQFARFGFFHLLKSRDCQYPSFFTLLIENNIYYSEEIITIMGYLSKSRVLWDMKYSPNGHAKIRIW